MSIQGTYRLAQCSLFRPVRLPRSRIASLCADAAVLLRVGDLAGADLLSVAAANYVSRYFERRDRVQL